MHTSLYKRVFPYLALGALVIPLGSGWTGALAGPAASVGAARQLRAVPLTGAEMAAMGLSQSGYTINQQQATTFASPAFQRVWERTDKPVASSQVQRSWYWGPTPISSGLQEDYAEGQGGKRLVQYFDKSRMEINNPAGDANSPFFVTNGLLTVELISGQMQTGNNTYATRYPADIPLASDTDDANAPTYLSFQSVSNTTLGNRPADAQMNKPVTATIARNGQVGDDQTKISYPKTTVAYYDPTTRHNVPQAIWEFLNDQGPVYDSATGKTANARLSDPWFYATGLPISEAYWARVKIAGQQQDVLIQAFERRVVTYTPNGVPGFKVQMGNIGQHYYDWRYKNAGQPATTPTSVPVSPAATSTAKPQTPTPPAATSTPTPNPASDCSGIPASQNVTVTPNCGPGGTVFIFSGSGFKPGENVGIYVTAPDQSVVGAPFQAEADSNGRVGGISLSSTRDFPTGVWAITMEGTSSRNKSIGYFKITSTAPPPTPVGGGAPPPGASSCSDVPASRNMVVRPNNCSRGGTLFSFLGSGFKGGELVGVYLTAPDQSVVGAPFQVNSDSNGNSEGVSFQTNASFPLGIYALTMEGTQSRSVAIGYFKLIP